MTDGPPPARRDTPDHRGAPSARPGRPKSGGRRGGVPSGATSGNVTGSVTGSVTGGLPGGGGAAAARQPERPDPAEPRKKPTEPHKVPIHRRTEPVRTASEEPSHVPVLTTPREGTPEPVTDAATLAATAARFAGGTGPVAVDAERASGYRYGQRAYLIQIRRVGAGTALVDPVPFTDLAVLARAITPVEWVLHAASQDLPCLADLGLRPRVLFDTELAARLAGFERVGLAALTERLLGYTLEKHHSAADWSTRPLPASWLTYAALDVELLVELRYALGTELEKQGKLGWAEEEFAALIDAEPARPRPDPWRRTSGIHRVRGARGLARIRALWLARDELAATRDLAPGRLLPDSAIVAAAQADPVDEAALFALPGFGGRGARRLVRTWLRALADARRLPEGDLPAASPPTDGPPPPHRWQERDPVAAGRLTRSREAIGVLAAEYSLPPENLLAPDTVRRLAWTPPRPVTPASVADALAGYGARQWQLGLTAGPLAKALTD